MTYDKHRLILANKSQQEQNMIFEFPNEFGNPYLIIYYRTQIGKKYAALFSIKEDLELAQRYTETYLSLEENESNSLIRQSLWCSAVVSYAKCFTNAKSGRKLFLNIDECFKMKTDTIFIELHDLIMDIRHNFLAHGGTSKLSKLEYLLLVNNDLNDKRISSTVVNSNTTDIGNSQIKLFVELIEFILVYIEERIKSTFTHLSKEVTSKPLDFWYSLIQSGTMEYDGTI